MNEDEILKIFPTVIQTSVLDDFTEKKKIVLNNTKSNQILVY